MFLAIENLLGIRSDVEVHGRCVSVKVVNVNINVNVNVSDSTKVDVFVVTINAVSETRRRPVSYATALFRTSDGDEASS